jgi:integrase
MSPPPRGTAYGIDTKTRYQGVFARHKRGCAVERGERCRCQPSYFGVVYDRASKRRHKTKCVAAAEAARNARADLLAQIQRGEATTAGALRLTDARTQFAAAAREGKALNKQGRRYKPRSIDDVDEALRVHVEPTLGTKRLTTIRRGDIQRIVDELAPRLSGSRVRSVVNAVRSLYRWAQDRDLASHDPAALVRLPAMNATPIERVASPAEFAQLLAALPLEMALPYALAGYGMGRRVQIIHLDWTDVDLDRAALEWGARLEARKYDASQRVVPIVPPLVVLLRRRFLELGRPASGLVCPPLASWASSGLLNTGWLAKRAREVWDHRQLRGITLQEARHTAGTWLDAAGVSPKVASVLMGHAVPERQPGAATITLARYTHALPEDIERARDLLAAYLREGARLAAIDRGE